VDFENAAIPDLVRITDWEDSWAYRIGIQKQWRSFAVRAGYYRDKTPQPVRDIGPILADADRNAYTLGIGYGTERWGVDVSDLYIKFDDRSTTSENNDRFFGRYEEAANVFAVSLRVSF
jgi:long-subunit fatty acid transport protein